MHRVRVGRWLIAPAFALLCGIAAMSPSSSFAAGGYSAGNTGYDVSWPQCPSNFPTGSFTIAVAGVNNGKAMTANPCFAAALSWAKQSPRVASLYLNTNAPPGTYVGTTSAGAACGRKDTQCSSYSYGRDAANYAVLHSVAGSGVTQLWLDVETGNSWSRDTAANAQVLQGMMDVLSGRYSVGLYSTSYQYGKIAGNYVFPNNLAPALWIPGAGSLANAAAFCGTVPKFAGGAPALVQWTATYDQDYAC
jgi:hypothetical protein